MFESNKQVVRVAFDRIWNNGDVEGAGQVYTDDYVHRANGMADVTGLESLRQVLIGLRAAFPDGRFTLERLIAEDDVVAARWRYHGTHRGEWMGMSASGKAIEFTGTSIVRIAGGKIAEQLSADYDRASLFRQIGALAYPATAEANRALCRAWLEAFNADDPSDVDRIVSADFLYQASGLSDLEGPAKTKEMIRSFRTAFPDGRFVLEENVATEAGGVNRWSYSGTHLGEWMGLPPTGKQVRVTGTTWIRVSDGKIVHQWCDWDAQSLFAQIRASD